MSTATKIEWAETTWNPTTGCDRISPGCDHCYALTLAKRLKAMGSAKYQADGDPRTSGLGFAVTVHQDALWEPLRWRKPRLVFVNSMSDIGHARVPREAIVRIWAAMALTRRHTFQVLTKRPKRLAALLSDTTFAREVSEQASQVSRLSPLAGLGTADRMDDWTQVDNGAAVPPWPLPNVWIGTSIESDDYTWRADFLRRTPAAVRFLSLEPLLGPLPSLSLDGIHWLIVGGESGDGARPMNAVWARSLVDQGAEWKVPVFVKQLGSVLGREVGAGPKGGDWDMWPEDLRVREFPAEPLVPWGSVWPVPGAAMTP